MCPICWHFVRIEAVLGRGYLWFVLVSILPNQVLSWAFMNLCIYTAALLTWFIYIYFIFIYILMIFYSFMVFFLVIFLQALFIFRHFHHSLFLFCAKVFVFVNIYNHCQHLPETVIWAYLSLPISLTCPYFFLVLAMEGQILKCGVILMCSWSV